MFFSRPMMGDESSRPRRATLARLWPYALVLAAYFATSPFHHGLNNPNEMVRVYMTKAAVDEGTFVIDKVVNEWGPVDDKAIRDGKLYSSKAPLQSILGIPAYWGAKHLGLLDPQRPGGPIGKRHVTWLLRIVGSVIPSTLFAFVILAFARRRAVELGARLSEGTGVGLAIALGTMLYPYALTFTGHGLAAIAAGGAHFAVLAALRAPPGSRRFLVSSIAAGFLAGASPFAEYPSALMAAPALVAGLIAIPGARAKGTFFACLAIGGLPTFGLGLWSHAELWGSPFKTGYSFLENKVYAESHHGSGFFGVKAPRPEAFIGSTFSPATGLFFYSPMLLVGFIAALRSLRSADRAIRATAWAAVVGVAFELLFISGHTHWRGGWTLGPRYIVSVAPVLGLWCVEALAHRRLALTLPALGAISVGITGFAAAIYPHLSDVYSAPVGTFVFPSYFAGFGSYGVADSLGLKGHAANVPHLTLLVVALIAIVAQAGRLRVAAISSAVFCASLIGVGLIPEHNPAAAIAENERLWGFWEPTHVPADTAAFSLVKRHRTAIVSSVGPDGVRTCRWQGEACSYGDEAWHHYSPETLEVGGRQRRLLFMHPIQGKTVRASFSAAKSLVRGNFAFGLTDASFQSDNQIPVGVRLLEGGRVLFEGRAGTTKGLTEIAFTRTSTAPVVVEITSEKDGARVFAFNVTLDD